MPHGSKEIVLKKLNKYRITIENEATLEKRFSFTSNIIIFLGLGLLILIIMGGIVIVLLCATPLKGTLPGHLKESERTATEAQHQRLDSLIQVYQQNKAYLSGLLSALQPPETDTLKIKEGRETNILFPDTLLPTSPEEKKFLEEIRERDKYNISLSALSDAEALMFENINPSAVFVTDKEDELKAELIIPTGAAVDAVAEGKIISTGISAAEPQFYEVIIQHPKGFISKTGRLSSLMVKPGSRVTGGQAIGLTSSKSGKSRNIVTFELWKDGNPLPPMKFLHSYSSEEGEN